MFKNCTGSINRTVKEHPMIASLSLNRLANERRLAPFASWDEDGPQTDYVTLPMNAEATRFYQENGFLVVENGLTPAEVDGLNAEAAQICRGERGDIRGLSPSDAAESDVDVMRRYLCIHFPHKLSDEMYQTLAHP